MKQTKKYTAACKLATIPHSTQDELYRELNRLGFFWNQKAQSWERDDRLADPPSGLLRLRVWAATEKVDHLAEVTIEALQQYGLKFQERSEPYVCRPPKQKESRIYLSFVEECEE